MGKRKGKTAEKRVALDGGEGLTDNPFAKLAGLRAELPSAPEEQDALPPPLNSTEIEIETETQTQTQTKTRAPARAVLRYERKGRGGKACTVIEKLDLTSAQLDSWCKELKRKLGCGGVVEDDAIVLSGDLRERLPDILRARGIKRLSVN